MALYDRQTDPALETEGILVDFGDLRVKVARMGGANKAYDLALTKALQPHRKVIATGQMDQDTEAELVFRVFARTCVLEWWTKLSTLPPAERTPQREHEAADNEGYVKGIDQRGKLVPMSVEAVVQVFKDLPTQVFAPLQDAARDYRNFVAAQREDDSGN